MARKDSELKTRPIIFIKGAIANVKDDEVESITLVVTNAGLGPALNIRSRLGEDIRMPGSGTFVKSDIFQESSIIQVLPNNASSLYASSLSSNNTINMVLRDSSWVDFSGGVSGISENAIQSSTTLLILLAKRPDGQAQLKLHALGLTKEEFENTLNDAVFITQASSMTNSLVVYKNRPKRSDTIEQVE